MQQNGIDVWMDARRLEGGDAWDEVAIGQVKEADYFIVLNSRQLAAKNEFSYVYKEVAVALDKQKHARQGTRFIIPVKLDDVRRIPGLDGIQGRCRSLEPRLSAGDQHDQTRLPAAGPPS